MSDSIHPKTREALDLAFEQEARSLEQQLEAAPLPSPQAILERVRDPAEERLALLAKRRRLAFLPVRLAPLAAGVSFLVTRLPATFGERVLSADLPARVQPALSLASGSASAAVGAATLVVSVALSLACVSIQDSWSS